MKTKRNARNLIIKLAPEISQTNVAKQAENPVDDMQHRWLSIYEQVL